jgi:hypothetical protein
MAALVQSELPLRVPVCAWCEPRPAGTRTAVSHGICPRHFEQIKSEASAHPAPPRRRLSKSRPDPKFQTEFVALA